MERREREAGVEEQRGTALFLAVHAERDRERERLGGIGAELRLREYPIGDAEGAHATAVQVVPALREVVRHQPQLRVVAEREAGADEQPSAGGQAVRVLFVAGEHRRADVAQAVRQPAGEILEHAADGAGQVGAAHEAEIADVEVRLQIVQRAAHERADARRDGDVRIDAVAPFLVHFAGDELRIPLDFAAAAQPVRVHAMHAGGVEALVHHGAHVADAAPTAAGAVLVEQPGGAEDAPVGGEDAVLAVARAAQLHVVLEGAEHSVANAAGLPDQLGGAEEVGRRAEFHAGNVPLVRHFHMARRAADAPRVEQRRRLAEEGLRRTAGALPLRTARRGLRIGARRGLEDLVAFEEEQPLLREEGLEGREVHHHVVRLDGAEVRVERGGQLHVGGRPPHDVQPGVGGLLVVDAVGERGSVGEHRPLPRRPHLLQRHRLERGHEARRRERQHRPAVAFVHVRDLAIDPEAEGAVRAGLRHGHHRPRQEHLHAPAAFGHRRGAGPRAVPKMRDGALRGDLAVRQRTAEIDREPVAVEAGAGGVQGDAVAVAVDVLVAGGQPRHQRIRRLLHHRRDVQAVVRVDEARRRAIGGFVERLRLHHAHVVVGRSVPPRRFVHPPIDDDVRILDARGDDHGHCVVVGRRRVGGHPALDQRRCHGGSRRIVSGFDRIAQRRGIFFERPFIDGYHRFGKRWRIVHGLRRRHRGSTPRRRRRSILVCARGPPSRRLHRVGEKPAVLPFAAPRPFDLLPRLRFRQPLGDDAMPPHAVAERLHHAQLQAEHRA